ncbi:MAG: alanine racemase, partial [Anaerolineales bacterium]|nr:alanine racemase [Anaerolineales bacterium]
QSIYNEAVDVLANAARELGQVARVHIKIDTGLSRVGVPFGAALPFVVDVAARPELALAGLFTTLVEDEAFDPVQITRLNEVVAAMQAQGIDPGIVHAASSAAVIQGTAPLLDMVRVGNGFYGFEPQTLVDTKPILSLHARVITVKTLMPGDSIAYHRRGLIERETRVATLPVGYADGYPFNAVDNGAQVLIRGRRWPLIVYMSANHVTVDVTGGPEIQVGDEAVLFGRQGDAEISISELARWGSSSEYKICTNLSPLLPRVFRYSGVDIA